MGSSTSAIARPSSAVQRYFEVSLFLLLMTSVLTLVSTGKLDLFSIFAAPAALLWKGWRWSRGYGAELSHRVATWLVGLYIVFFPIDLWVISRGLAAEAQSPALFGALLATVHLLLFAMIVRLYSATTTRDYLFLTLLSFAAVLAAAILTVDTAYLGFFFVYLVLGVSTFAGLEIRRAAEGAAAPPLEAGTPQASRLNRALGMTSASVAVGALVLGAVIFFFIPRFTAGYLSGFNLQPSLISGFSDDVELGQIGEIKKDNRVVMRVRVEGGQIPGQTLRWRGIALTNFDGRRWYSEERLQQTILPTDGWFLFGSPSRLLQQNSVPVHFTALLEPMASEAIFLLPRTARVRGRFAPAGSRPGNASASGQLVMDQTGSVFNPFGNFMKLRYEGMSLWPKFSAEQLRGASAGYPEVIRRTYLQLPKLDPRIAQLATQITRGALTAYDKAAVIEQHLRTRYGYTLDLSGKPGSDPLAYFLFTKRAGHCEYFAAAMTVLLRTQGIPARYVNGFLPGEFNDVGEDYIVRASDAHSWVEVYFPEFGWITFDPTPPADALERSWFARLAFYWDWLDLMWSEWVINYDFVHQATLVQGLQRGSREWSARTGEFFARMRKTGKETLEHWTEKAARLHVVLPLLLGALLAAVLFALRRRVAEVLRIWWELRRGSRAALTPQLATLQYQKMLRLFERRGMRKAAGQTPLEFAAAVGSQELASPVAQMTELYQASRFGEHAGNFQQMATLVEGIKNLLQARSR